MLQDVSITIYYNIYEVNYLIEHTILSTQEILVTSLNVLSREILVIQRAINF